MKKSRKKAIFCCSNGFCFNSAKEKLTFSSFFNFVRMSLSILSIMSPLSNTSSRQVVALGFLRRVQHRAIRRHCASWETGTQIVCRHSRQYGNGFPSLRIPSSSVFDTCQQIRLLSKSQRNNNNDMEFALSKIELLTSKTSSTVKLFSSLLSNNRKVREANNLAVVEGYRLVLDILTNPYTAHLIHHVLVTERALYHHPEFSPALQACILLNCKNNKSDFRINLASENVIAACSDTVTPQGVVATCTIPDPFDYTMSNASDITPKIYLILDGVSDPGNVGTLIRSSVACGISAIFLLPGCVDPYSSKALRSAMGATFRIPLKSFSRIDECWEFLNSCCGVTKERIYAATLDASTLRPEQNDDPEKQIKSTSPMHTDIDWITDSSNGIGSSTTDSAIIIGREGSGLSSEIRNAVLCGKISSVHVAMEGGMESLNAAVCGSVILFEYARQKREYVRRIGNDARR